MSRITGPRVSEWVPSELEAAYHRLETEATPVKSPQLTSIADPLEELADRVAERDFTRIAQMHAAPGDDPMVKKTSGQSGTPQEDMGGRRKRVSNILTFALKIQAAGVNRRLKHDIADQVPTLQPEVLKGLSLFEPEVSDQAFHAFEQYVEAKWPLRVYAIEPVIAQQNIADVMGRRTQSALDLVGAGLIGPAKARHGLRHRPPRGRR